MRKPGSLDLGVDGGVPNQPEPNDSLWLRRSVAKFTALSLLTENG